MKGTAYFVKSPGKLTNLVTPHRVEDEVSFEIVHTIYLPQIDYENFATDLTVDRAFIEENAYLCGVHDGIWKCLLIQQENTKTGILVMPEGHCWVGFAAYYGYSVPKFPK